MSEVSITINFLVGATRELMDDEKPTVTTEYGGQCSVERNDTKSQKKTNFSLHCYKKLDHFTMGNLLYFNWQILYIGGVKELKCPLSDKINEQKA
jgi:hypothetical protein